MKLMDLGDETYLRQTPSKPDANAAREAVQKSIEILERLQNSSFAQGQL